MITEAIAAIGYFPIVIKVVPASTCRRWKAQLADRMQWRINVLQLAQFVMHNPDTIHETNVGRPALDNLFKVFSLEALCSLYLFFVRRVSRESIDIIDTLMGENEPGKSVRVTQTDNGVP